MLGVIHHMGGQGVKREEVSDNFLLLSVYHFRLADDVSVDYLVPWQEVMLHFLISKVKFYNIFPIFRKISTKVLRSKV